MKMNVFVKKILELRLRAFHFVFSVLSAALRGDVVEVAHSTILEGGDLVIGES